VVAEWAMSMSAKDLLAACVEYDVPCALVNTIEDIFSDPQFSERSNLITLPTESGNTFTVPNTIPKLSKTAGAIQSLGPMLGGSNVEVYCGELGVSESEFEILKKQKVI